MCLAQIILSRLVPSSLNKGRPIVLEEPTSEVSTAVRFVAQKLTGQLAEGGSAVTEAAADKKRMKKQKKPKDPPDQNPKQQRKLFSRSA